MGYCKILHKLKASEISHSISHREVSNCTRYIYINACSVEHEIAMQNMGNYFMHILIIENCTRKYIF